MAPPAADQAKARVSELDMRVFCAGAIEFARNMPKLK